MKLSFLGATETVTGSKYLIENNDKKILIDCGLFQGHKTLRLRNWAKLPFDPATLDAVILTHAHIDHSGYIPLLVKHGFKGKIYCSSATYDLCKILLPDSGYLQEEDARRANKYGYSRHDVAKALYTQADAMAALTNFHPVKFHKAFKIGDDLEITLSRAGHILGAAFIHIDNGQKTIVFSGDIGRPNDPVMVLPEHIEAADYLVVESTYGDRLHDKADPVDMIGDVITSTAAKGGMVVIPAFAVGRSQNLLYYIHDLKRKGKIPNIPIYLDSPMAINVTNLLCRHGDDHKLSNQEWADVCDIATYTKSVEESKNIGRQAMPSIIISASGMATGGRILHHLKNYIGDSRHTILFTGFQAGGTRGDRILKGEKDIKIHGQMWPVRARIEYMGNTSAHADYQEILDWLSYVKTPPLKVFVIHGESEASTALRDKIEETYGWDVCVPKYLQQVEL